MSGRGWQYTQYDTQHKYRPGQFFPGENTVIAEGQPLWYHPHQGELYQPFNPSDVKDICKEAPSPVKMSIWSVYEKLVLQAHYILMMDISFTEPAFLDRWCFRFLYGLLTWVTMVIINQDQWADTATALEVAVKHFCVGLIRTRSQHMHRGRNGCTIMQKD